MFVLISILTDNVVAFSTSPIDKKHIVLSTNYLKNNPLLESDVVYEIRSDIDLEGKKICLPSGCVLSFKEGKIKNGQIEGVLTDIDCDRFNERIFENVIILGSWICYYISISWINYHVDGMIQSILGLQNPDIFQVITFPYDNIEWTPTEKVSCLVDIKSNCRVLINKSIKTHTNNLTSYEVFYINNQHNITIEGGEIIGDCDTHIPVKGSTSEGCHGIRIRGGHDITIRHVISRNHNGDGIFVRGISYSTQTKKNSDEVTNLLVSNCTLENNRRQGISLCAAMNNVKIDSCKITDTGKTNGTAPCAGIDIEPISFFADIRNLTISNCFFKGNQGQAIDYNGYYFNDNIVIENCYCEADGINVRQTEGILLLGALNNIVIRNCSFPVFNISGNKIEEVSKYPHNTISVENCFFNVAYISNNQIFTNSDVRFNHCTFDKGNHLYWKNVSTLTLNLPISYSFINCTIIGGYSQDLLTVNKRSNNLYFSNCNIQTSSPFTILEGNYLNNDIDCLFLDISAQDDITFTSNNVITHSKMQRLRLSNGQCRNVQLYNNLILGENSNVIKGNNMKIENIFITNNKWDTSDVENNIYIIDNIRDFFEKRSVDNSVYCDEHIIIEKFDKHLSVRTE